MSSARQISGAPETPPLPSSSGRGAADSSVRRMRSGETRAASPFPRGVEGRRPEASRALLGVWRRLVVEVRVGFVRCREVGLEAGRARQVEQRRGRTVLVILGRAVGAVLTASFLWRQCLMTQRNLPVIESRAWYDTLPP